MSEKSRTASNDRNVFATAHSRPNSEESYVSQPIYRRYQTRSAKKLTEFERVPLEKTALKQKIREDTPPDSP